MNTCQTCSRQYVYERGKSCTTTKCNTCYVAGNRKNRKKLAIQLFGGGCQKCGYNISFRSLTFHHIDPSEKLFNISVCHTASWQRYVDELKKCCLLCQNCHNELHDGLWNIQAIKRVEIPSSIYDLVIPTGRDSFEPKITRYCRWCEKDFLVTRHSRRKFCSSKCYRESTHKVQWPTLEQLALDIATMSWCAIGRKYGVSDNAVRKWARSYNLIL